MNSIFGRQDKIAEETQNCEVFFKVYKNGKSIAEIADEQGAEAYSIYLNKAAVIRKLRHPSSSKQLKGFLKEENKK